MARITTRHFPEADLVVFEAMGRFEVIEAIEASDAFFARHLVRDSVWDMRNTTVDDVDIHVMRTSYAKSKRHSHRRSDRRTALVVSDSFHAVLTRLYASVAEAQQSPIQYRSFTDLDEAYVWLGKPRPSIQHPS